LIGPPLVCGGPWSGQLDMVLFHDMHLAYLHLILMDADVLCISIRKTALKLK